MSMHSKPREIIRFIIGCLFIAITLSFFIQLLFPAPRWSDICEGSSCGEQAQRIIQQQESNYFAIVSRFSFIFLVGPLILAFVFRKKSRWLKLMVMLAVASALVPVLRERLFEYGNYPPVLLTISIYAILLLMYLVVR